MMGFTLGELLILGVALMAYLAWREARLSRKERADSIRILAEHISSISTAHAASLHQAVRDEATAQVKNLSAHVNVVSEGHARDLHQVLNEQLGAVQNTLEQRLAPSALVAAPGRFDRLETLPPSRRRRAVETKA
jgi:hypothetical protein